MSCKFSLKLLAVLMSLATVVLTLSSCSFKKAETAAAEPEGNQTLAWVIKPDIKADSIEPLTMVVFNKNTNHYDISYSEYFKIRVNGQYGIIALDGKMFLPTIYSDIFTVRDGDDFIAVSQTDNKKTQLYVHSDTFKTETAYKTYNDEKYEYCFNDEIGKTIFVKNSSGNYTDEEFAPKLPETIVSVKKTSAGYISNNKFGLYSNGEEITSMIYTGAGCFNDGVAAFKSNNVWGYLDSTGKTVIPFDYDAVKGYSAFGTADTPYESYNGYVTVCKNNKFGILKSDGTKVTDLVYDGATPVVNGMAFACVNGKWGVISVEGEHTTGTAPDTENTTEPTTTSTTSAAETTTTVTTTTEKTTTTAASTTMSSGKGDYKINLSADESASMRSGAGYDNKSIGSIYGGEVVYVDEVKDGWGHTVYGGIGGWFNLQYAEKY